jgi:mono/diheme cytochrome c family protein
VFLLLAAAGVCGLAALLWFVRGHSFSARDRPSAVEGFIARRLRNFSIPGAAARMRNPLQATELAIAEGRDHFADHCAVCHANDGSGNVEMGRNLYPPAPDMREPSTQKLTDGELYYLIRNGVRFTGMPGWGGDSEENWKLVLFIRHLPEIQPIELQFMNEVNHLGPEAHGGDGPNKTHTF